MKHLATYLKLVAIACCLGISASGTAQVITSVPDAVHDAFNALMNYVNNLPADKDFTPPPPPSTYFDYCFPCDKKRQQEFARDSIKFVDVYMGDEITQMKNVNTVLAWTRKNPSAREVANSTFKAALTVSQRMQAKLVAAWKQYKDISEKVPFLADRMIEQHRANELVGVKSDAGMPLVGDILAFRVLSYMNKLKEAKKELDYPIILNGDLIFDAFRSAEMIGISTTQLGDNIFNYRGLGRFQFTIETKAKIQAPDGTTYAASLSNKSFFWAKPGKNCELQWILREPDTAKMIYDLKDISIRIPKPLQPVFGGTTKYTSIPPEVKLDFCDEAHNTLHFFGFSHGPRLETWFYKGQVFPASAVLQAYTVSFPDMKQYTNFQNGTSASLSVVPFGFYVEQAPKNKNPVILEKTIDASQVSMTPQNVVYGDFKIKIEHAPKKD